MEYKVKRWTFKEHRCVVRAGGSANYERVAYAASGDVNAFFRLGWCFFS